MKSRGVGLIREQFQHLNSALEASVSVAPSEPRALQVCGYVAVHAAWLWLQALAGQAGAEGAHECDTPFLNKQLCLNLTYQSTKGELGFLQSFGKSLDLEQRVKVRGDEDYDDDKQKRRAPESSPVISARLIYHHWVYTEPMSSADRGPL